MKNGLMKRLPQPYLRETRKITKNREESADNRLAASVIAVLSRARFEQRQRRSHCGLGRDADAYVLIPAMERLGNLRRFPVRLPSWFGTPGFHTFATTIFGTPCDLEPAGSRRSEDDLHERGAHTNIATTANLHSHVAETLQAQHAERVESVIGWALRLPSAAGSTRFLDWVSPT